MKRTLTLLSLLASPVLLAQGPADIANHTVSIHMTGAQVARSRMYQVPELPWHTWKEVTDFVIDFPESSGFSTTAEYSVNLRKDLAVSYHSQTNEGKAYVKLEGADLSVLVTLTYTDNSSGTAEIVWHEAGDTRHIRNTTFSVQQDSDAASRVDLPEEIIACDPEMWNDGLADILKEIEAARYKNATDKLYQKRLITLLPQVMMTFDASYTNPDYKGNTALHYACGLSHVKLVQWLVDHGADLQMSTDKGASIDACIGGKNAARIKAVLQEARAWRDAPYQGPKVTDEEARQAADFMDIAFAGVDLGKKDYSFTINDAETEHKARILYRYIKDDNSVISLCLCPTDMTAIHLTRVLNAKMTEDQFVESIMRDLTQRRFYMQQVYRKDSFILSHLPHMILTREDEGMDYDAASAVYHAACEGNVELVRWLISHGANRQLINEEGRSVKLPADTPRYDEVQKALQMKD
ncbi:MAG: ankyrin repeat domain-containing protein [Akkermansia sp.]|nr:ankyrin repeat domain-containing protein [Akkermansia sp.]